MEFVVYTISIRGFFTKAYDIYLDEELVYQAEKPSFFAFGEMDFFDRSGAALQKLYRNSSFFRHKYTITREGRKIASFEKYAMENSYKSQSIFGEYSIKGQFLDNEYTIFKGRDEIAKISRKRFQSQNKYGVAIIKGHDELYILAMVIAISLINKKSKKGG